ncbi:MAG: hypothetical protein JSV50_04210 [Desulfobacteraceae bacterium]|nr:MAG: hypothetical protein JSV50_04210 [Desulfobacteraceae bacterium]
MADQNLERNRKNLATCLSIYSKSVDLEFEMRLAEEVDHANELSKKNDKMEEEIKRLRGKMLDDWTAQVSNLSSELETMSEQVKAAIDDIKGDIESAKRFVALTGHLDTILGVLIRIGLKIP